MRTSSIILAAAKADCYSLVIWLSHMSNPGYGSRAFGSGLIMIFDAGVAFLAGVVLVLLGIA